MGNTVELLQAQGASILGNEFTSRAALLVLRPLTIVVGVFLPLAFGTFASDLQMKIEDVRFDTGALVKFLEVGSDQVSVNPDALKRMIAGQTGDHQFTVFADVDSITVNPSFEDYDFYVRSASATASALLTRFTFQVTPYDMFPDQDKSLQIH